MELKFEPVDVTGFTASKILVAEVEGGYLVIIGRSGSVAFVPKAPEFQALGELKVSTAALHEAIDEVAQMVPIAKEMGITADELAAAAGEAQNMLDEDKPNGKAWKTEPEGVPPVGVRLSRRGRRVHRYTGDETDALLMIDKPTACGKTIAWKKSDVRTTTEPINCPDCAKADEEKGK